LRACGPEGIGRAIYCFTVGQRVVMLHAFIKKRRAISAIDLSIVRRSMREVRRG
jgi:phage-related protein